MRIRTIAIIAGGVVAAGVVVAFAGPAFYRDVIVGPAAPAPTITGTAAGALVEAADVEGAWRVGSGSYAGYRVDEVLNGTDVTVVGRTEQVTGELTVTDGALTAASVTVDVASIATDQGSRDSYFRNTAMQTFRYPTATFTLTEPVVASSEVRTGAAQRVTATGELTLAGVTRQVEVSMQAVFDGERAEVAGSIPITFADFGIDAPSLGFVRVEDSGAVEFSLVLVR
ncbi:YceI family protein [Microbacterium luticocti]|uniref:YceI family protein n=1 Tax=Microbacterium luticocti TaxID=451764 RepID=UPI0003F619EC|nr:YceI family protein [Microbacterium luticocti]